MPIDAERGVIKGDSTLMIWTIKIITFISENHRFRKNGKSVRKTTRDKQLAFIFPRQFHCDMPAEGR